MFTKVVFSTMQAGVDMVGFNNASQAHAVVGKKCCLSYLHSYYALLYKCLDDLTAYSPQK